MNTVKVIIEYDGEVILNGEYRAVAGAARPLSLTWFPANDLVIDAGGEKMIFNTENFGDCVTAVDANTFIIRPHGKIAVEKEMLHEKKNEENLVITASEAHTIFNEKLTLEIAEGGTQKFFTLTKADGTKYAYPFPHETAARTDTVPVQEKFTGLIVSGDYTDAKKLLAFDISVENLKNFFTQHPPVAENFDFEIKNGLIQNLSPKSLS